MKVDKATLPLALAALILAGCASQPEKLQKQYVSPTRYENLECSRLSAELERLSGREIELYNALKDLADNDEAQMGVGLILLWPTLFFLEGGDGPQAAEYSRIKGEQDAIEQVMVQKRCSTSTTTTTEERDKLRGATDRLRELEALRKDGTISEEEYQKTRKRILDGI